MSLISHIVKTGQNSDKTSFSSQPSNHQQLTFSRAEEEVRKMKSNTAIAIARTWGCHSTSFHDRFGSLRVNGKNEKGEGCEEGDKFEVHDEPDKNEFHLIEFHGETSKIFLAIIAVALAICILAGCFCCLRKNKASMRAASANTRVMDLLAHWQKPAADNTNQMRQFMMLMNQQRGATLLLLPAPQSLPALPPPVERPALTYRPPMPEPSAPTHGPYHNVPQPRQPPTPRWRLRRQNKQKP